MDDGIVDSFQNVPKMVFEFFVNCNEAHNIRVVLYENTVDSG